MSQIFQQGQFRSFAVSQVTGAQAPIMESVRYSEAKTTVFISHKHDDLDDLKGVLGFLEQTYNIKVYIDSQDPSMPIITSAETAENIKQRIRQCQKFILLATNNAIESKWCNWELGYGDAHRYKDNIALFPMKPCGAYDFQYKGSEYLQIYPYITYSDGSEKYDNGAYISKGYYVVKPTNGQSIYTPLSKWFSS